MAIWYEQRDDVFVIYIDESELTEAIIDRMRQVLTVAFLHRRYNILFDLSSCVLIDSYFIALMISIHRELKELGGSLKCSGVQGQVQQAFELIRLNKVIDIHPTNEKAIQSFSATSSDSINTKD